MSNLVKSEQSNGKVAPSGRGARGKKVQRQAVELKATEATPVEIVGDSTLVGAAIDLADSEVGAAANAYLARQGENLPALAAFFRNVQAANAAAFRQAAFDEFQVTQEMLYGEETDDA